MPGQRGEADPFSQVRRFKDMPLNYQELGRACVELDLEEEFYWLVDAGYDFGRVFPTICQHIKRVLDLDSVDEVKTWLSLKYDIDLTEDDSIDGTRRKW